MGLSLPKLFDSFFCVQPNRILMVGLDAAGKTTILYKLKLIQVANVKTVEYKRYQRKFEEALSSNPTVGFNVETVEYNQLKMAIWDVGGSYKIRRLWQHYYEGSSALIYVIDSADKDRIQEAKEEFSDLVASEKLKNAKILIYANKQDIATLSVAEIAQEMGLYELKQKDWYIQGVCALDGDGLYLGLDWLVEALKNNNK